MGQLFPPLDDVTAPNVSTEQAAFYIGRKPQTLRSWSCHDRGPIRPIRIGRTLAWPVPELKRLTGLVPSPK
jgi:hypothetical protein